MKPTTSAKASNSTKNNTNPAPVSKYSAAVLKSWQRAKFIGGLLVGLYATLYVLLNLEAYSLIIGSLLLFVALAVVMWATRAIDWGAKREVVEAPSASATSKA